jgi:Flp pilus assembly protein TadD
MESPDKQAHMQALNNLGQIHLLGGDHRRAAEFFRQAHETLPNRVSVALNLARAELQLGRPRRAVRALEPYTERYVKHPDLHRILGEGYLRSGRNAEALACFQHLEELVPGSALAASKAGQACTRMGRDAQAEAAFRRAIAADPDHFISWASLGNLLFRGGRFDEAVTAYGRAAALRPGDLKVKHNLELSRKSRDEREQPSPG